MAIQIVERRVARELWPGMWRAETTFAEEEADVKAAASALWGTTFPGWTGNDLPEYIGGDIVYRPGGIKGPAVIFARYETPGIGKAKIYVEYGGATPERVRRLETIPAKWLEGTPDGLHEWRVISGSNVKEGLSFTARIDTTYRPYAAGPPPTGYPLAAIHAAWNKVNTNDLTGLFGPVSMSAGKVRLLKVNRRPSRGKFIDVSFIIGYNPDVNQLKREIGLWLVQKQVVYDGLTPTDEVRHVHRFLAGYELNGDTPVYIGPSNITKAEFFGSANMDFLGPEALTEW